MALDAGHSSALCRPPAHHAYAALAGGFCYLNNSALAAEHMLRRTGGLVAVPHIDFHQGSASVDASEYDPLDVLNVTKGGMYTSRRDDRSREPSDDFRTGGWLPLRTPAVDPLDVSQRLRCGESWLANEPGVGAWGSSAPRRTSLRARLPIHAAEAALTRPDTAQ